MENQADIVGIIAPGKGMGNFISYLSHFRTINKLTGKKLLIFTKQSTSAKLFLSDQNYIQNIIYMSNDKKNFSLIDKIKFFKNLINNIKKNNINKIFILHPSKKYVIASKLSGVNNIYAPGYRLQNFLIKKKNKFYKSYFDKGLDPREECDQLIKKIFSINNLEENFIDKPYENYKKKYISICIATSGFEKQWGVNKYIKVIEYLSQNNHKNFCILSGKDQGDLEDQIIANFKTKNLNFIKTSSKKLDEIMELLLCSYLYVGNDTGLSHLSVSLRVPSIVIYGDCPAQFYSSYIKAIVIDEKEQRSRYSINQINFEKVKKVIDNYI